MVNFEEETSENGMIQVEKMQISRLLPFHCGFPMIPSDAPMKPWLLHDVQQGDVLPTRQLDGNGELEAATLQRL